MIIFKRPRTDSRNLERYGFDDVELRVDAGLDVGCDVILRYFVNFLQALTFHEDQIKNAMREYLEERDEAEKSASKRAD